MTADSNDAKDVRVYIVAEAGLTAKAEVGSSSAIPQSGAEAEQTDASTVADWIET